MANEAKHTPGPIEAAAILDRLFRKYCNAKGPLNVSLLQRVISRETALAEQGIIPVSRWLLRELRSDRALVGRLRRLHHV